MSKKLFVFFIRAFFSRINKRGFTLAEALIITVMTGACLLPILGTMQNAQVRTEKYDHYSKMQQYARSRLNAEIANAAFDHKSINLEDEYHYIVFFDEKGNSEDAKKIELTRTSINKQDLKSLDKAEVNDKWSKEACRIFGITKKDNLNKPYVKLIHAYKTSVEAKDNPQLAVFNPDIESEEDEEKIDTPKALMGIVVRTSLLESDDNPYDSNGYLMYSKATTATSAETDYELVKDETTQVVPVTLFAFVNLPAVSNEMIWLADAGKWKLHYIDPLGKTSVAIDLPKSYGNYTTSDDFKPYHIAVHPSLKFIVYQTNNHLMLMNIDRNSPNFNSIYRMGESHSSENIGEGGIAFRPDGQYLFVSDSNKKLTVYNFEWEYETGKTYIRWNPGSESGKSPKLTEKKYIDLDTQAISGFIPANDGFLYIAQSDKNNVLRTPMYPSIFDSNWKTEKVITLSSNINSIDVSPDGLMLAVVTLDGKLQIYNTKNGNNLSSSVIKKDNYSQPFKCSFATNSNTSFSSDKNLNITVTNNALKSSDNYELANVFSVTNENTTTSKTLEVTDNISVGGGFASVGPDNQNMILSDIENQYIFFLSTDIHTSTSESLSKYIGSVHDIKGKEISDLASSKRDVLAVAKADKYINFFNLNNLTKIEDYVLCATAPINTLAMNPQGDMLISGHGNIDNYKGNAGYCIDKSVSSGIFGENINKKIVFDDRTPNMSFALVKTGNAFYSLNADDGEWDNTFSINSYKRKSFSLSNDWERYDIIGMPNGGAMAVYGKPDGSSMIEWIGRIRWGNTSKIGKYRLFGRWTNVPELSHTNMVLPTYDMATITGNTIDSWNGRIHVLKYEEFPVNSVITKVVKAEAKNANGNSITPLIVEFLEPEMETFKIIDYSTQSLTFSGTNKTQTNVDINWKNGGKILNSNCRVAFWNGNINGNYNGGALKYISRTSGNFGEGGFVFVSDYYLSTVDDSKRDEDEAKIDKDTIITSGKVYKEFSKNINNGKNRKYTISFSATLNKENIDFPPLYSKRLAISPDCGTLAILSGVDEVTITDNHKIPRISLYDFNNQIYGQETQLEGMLVDYREPISNKTTVSHPFPKETGDPLFNKIGTNYSLNGDTSNLTTNFPSLTTKLGTYWSSFNDYPANFRLTSSNKGSYAVNYNKRFIGYLRPEYGVKHLQVKYSEDMRLFFNNSLISGAQYNDLVTLIPNPLPVIDCTAHTTGLLQADQSFSSEDRINLAVFLSNAATPGSFDAGDAKEDGSKFISDDTDWGPLKSEQTFILKNQPSFINSFSAVTESGVKLETDKSFMVFSRDRAKPVLYISDSSNLWVLYKNTLFRTIQSDDNSILTNIALSTDGQKLIYGKDSSDKKKISVFDISSPDENSFINTSSITAEKNVSTFINSYLSKIKDFSLDSAPSYIATKPHNSFSSVSIGGESKAITNDPVISGFNTTSFISGSMAVASGGIYIYDGNKSIICFNPATNKAEKFENVLKKTSPYAPMTSYDDTLYIFGNGGVTGNPKNGQLQSYDVNTGKAMASLLSDGIYDESKYTDEYQVNMGSVAPNGSNFYSPGVDNYFLNGNTGYMHTSYDDNDSYPPKASFIISNNPKYTWRGDNEETSWFVGYNNYNKIRVDKIKLSNYNSVKSDAGIKSFEFKVSTDNNIWVSALTEKTISNKDDASYSKIAEFNLENDTKIPYRYFKIIPKSNYYGGGILNTTERRSITINLFQLWRTKVKRLTPSVLEPSFTGYSLEQNVNSLDWVGETITTNMTWSDNQKENGSLIDVYIPYSSDTSQQNTVENNVFVQEKQGWYCDKAYPCIKICLSAPEAVCAVRYANSESYSPDRIKKIKLFGNNDTGEAIPGFDDTKLEENKKWEEISFAKDGAEKHFDGPDVVRTFITAEVKAPKKYRNYLFKVVDKYTSSNVLRISGFEMFSCPSSSGESPTSDYLTAMKTDQLQEVNVSHGACCSTPYGLVYTGGKNESNTAVKTALLYWPHAINKYDGQFYQFGIPRSLPDMKVARYGHALVWHKGKIYAIGGIGEDGECCWGDQTNSSEDYIECLDYNDKMEWKSVPVSNDKYYGNLNFGQLLKRNNFGACSFGDEIFVFDGGDGNSTTNGKCSAYAINPESKVIRKINDPTLTIGGTEVRLLPCSAVSFGSKIYIFGKDTSDNVFKMLEYTP